MTDPGGPTEGGFPAEPDLLQGILQISPIGIAVVDGDGTLTYANERADEIYGRSRKEITEFSYDDSRWDLVDEDGKPLEAGEVPFDRVVERGEAIYDQVIGLRRPSDERVWLSVNGAPQWDEDGDLKRAVFAFEDITEDVETQRKLAESELRYRTLTENFPNGTVGLFNEDLEYTAVGGQLLDTLGVKPKDRLGSRVSDIYPDELVEEIEPNFRAALDGEANSFEAEYHSRHLYAYTLPVRNADDEVFAGMLVVQDVTERREYQRRLEESNKRLEQFAHAAAHDLHEPLRMVSNYLQLLESQYSDELDQDGEEFIEYAVDAADRMQATIDGLLEYARVDTEGDSFKPVDLNAVLDDVRADLQLQIEETDADVTVDDLPHVQGDGDQLRQVFQNLLENAIAYTGDEPPRIHVSAEQDGSEWRLSVRDEGIGIDPDDQVRVFEVFKRLHSQVEDAGTGIGLALCERIIERHGGEIWVYSEPGEGSTFTVTLPAANEHDQEQD